LATWGIANPTQPGALVLTQYRPVSGGLPREVVLPTGVDPAARTLTTHLNQTGTAGQPGDPDDAGLPHPATLGLAGPTWIAQQTGSATSQWQSYDVPMDHPYRLYWYP